MPRNKIYLVTNITIMEEIRNISKVIHKILFYLEISLEKVINMGNTNKTTIPALNSKEPTSPLAKDCVIIDKTLISLSSSTTALSACSSATVFICSMIIYLCLIVDSVSFSAFSSGVGTSLPA